MTNTTREPPSFCQYADDPCDQDFSLLRPRSGLFLYPSEPVQIADTIERAVAMLRERTSIDHWHSWRDLNVAGQIVYCAICKAIRFADAIFVDVTTLNFNLLFEIGYALGLNQPIVPIRDTTVVKDEKDFNDLGLLDTLGYLDFQNSPQLTDSILKRLPVSAIPTPPAEINMHAPLYVLKGPHETDGEIKLLSEIKKSRVFFRTYDVVETPRLSLHEIRKQINASLGVVAHLINKDRKGSRVHNARAAIISGIAMAQGKAVLMVDEGPNNHPIDYRDIVASYNRIDHIPRLIEPLLRHIIEQLQSVRLSTVNAPEGLIQKLDLGDLAAENEIRLLDASFVPTGQYHEARRGHARLITGRKGAGKTAIFYAVRNSFSKGHSDLILDLKPEGHQFTRLREVILSRLTAGVKEHTLTAFWNAILLAELAHKIVSADGTWAYRDPERRVKYDRVSDLYHKSWLAEEGDFSQRLLKQVEHFTEAVQGSIDNDDYGQITQTLFRTSIRELNDAVASYLQEKNAVRLLVDNLDKGWPVGGATTEDILILRTLLEASRKLQREFDKRRVEFQCLVFIRNDIYDHLVRETPDKGKDTAVIVDWTDPAFFKSIYCARVRASGLLEGDFDELWAAVFDEAIGARRSFDYIVERTLLRPRDFLMFIHRSIEVSINRGHTRISADDLLKAEELYSDDILKAMGAELEGGALGDSNCMYAFIRSPARMNKDTARNTLLKVGITEQNIERTIELLVWFGFIGIEDNRSGETLYSYQVRYNLDRLLVPAACGNASFVIHPAFRKALGVIEH